MDLGLKGTVAVVTASSQGLGKAAASALAHEGANLIMCARRAHVLESAVAEISEASGAEVLGVRADVSTEDGANAVIRAAVARFGRIDILGRLCKLIARGG